VDLTSHTPLASSNMNAPLSAATGLPHTHTTPPPPIPPPMVGVSLPPTALLDVANDGTNLPMSSAAVPSVLDTSTRTASGIPTPTMDLPSHTPLASSNMNAPLSAASGLPLTHTTPLPPLPPPMVGASLPLTDLFDVATDRTKLPVRSASVPSVLDTSIRTSTGIPAPTIDLPSHTPLASSNLPEVRSMPLVALRPITHTSLAALRTEIISFAQSPNRPQIVLEIHPPEYGRVLVRAEQGAEGVVTVRLVVESVAVKEQVLLHLHRLPTPATVEVMTFDEYREQSESEGGRGRQEQRRQTPSTRKDESNTEFTV